VSRFYHEVDILNKEILTDLLKLKLQALSLMVELLPEPVKERAVKYRRVLAEILDEDVRLR